MRQTDKTKEVILIRLQILRNLWDNGRVLKKRLQILCNQYDNHNVKSSQEKTKEKLLLFTDLLQKCHLPNLYPINTVPYKYSKCALWKHECVFVPKARHFKHQSKTSTHLLPRDTDDVFCLPLGMRRDAAGEAALKDAIIIQYAKHLTKRFRDDTAQHCSRKNLSERKWNGTKLMPLMKDVVVLNIHTDK